VIADHCGFPSSERFREWVTQDWPVNESAKSKVVVTLVRVGSFGHQRRGVGGKLCSGLSKAINNWFFGVEIPPETQIGRLLTVFHPVAIVVNPEVVIGSRCTLRNSTTIGNRGVTKGNRTCPTLGDDVEVGASCVILGPITIGSRAKIAAGAVVVHDVAIDATVFGNPAAEKIRANVTPSLLPLENVR
jgi:putative colanic acid biosynthesis acetyltransferase WcaB